jgi:tetratricopeptide (TPR) repeat protein
VLSKLPAFLISGLLALAANSAGSQSLLETRIEFEELARSGKLEAATALGDRLLDEARETFGAASAELADTQLLLARVQTANEEHLEAEANVLEAISILENTYGEQSPDLILPMIILGETYDAAGEYELSLGAYAEARDIGRRTYGLLNEDQISILDRISLTRLAMGDYDAARDVQFEAIDLVQRIYGEDSIEYLDAHFRYGYWLNNLGDYDEAERTYYAMQRIIDRVFDRDPIQTIRLLRARSANQLLANTNGGSPRLKAQRDGVAGLNGTQPAFLESALKIARKLDDPDPVLEASLLRDIGDWNVAFGRAFDIAEPYEAAWNILAEVEGGADLQRDWFSEQIVIRSAPFWSPYFVAENDAPRGRIDLAFTIEADGRPVDVEIIGAIPAGLIEESAARQIQYTRFRPRLVDGKVVATEGAFTWRFRYDPERIERFSNNL